MNSWRFYFRNAFHLHLLMFLSHFLLSSICHSDMTFISIMVLFFSSFFLLPRPLIVFKFIVLLLLLNEAPIHWPPEAKSQLRKDHYAVKDWRQEEKRTTEEEMIGWHHWFKLWEMVKDREAWHTIVHGVAKNQTWLWLNNNTFIWVLEGIKFYLRAN